MSQNLIKYTMEKSKWDLENLLNEAEKDYKYNYKKAVFGYSLPFGVLGGMAGISHLATDNNYLANIATIISGLYLYVTTGPAYVEEMRDILRDLRHSKKLVDNYRRKINRP